MQSKSSKHIEPHHVFIIFLILLTFAATIIILVYGYMTYTKTKYVYDKVKKVDDKVQMINMRIQNLLQNDKIKSLIQETICSQCKLIPQGFPVPPICNQQCPKN